MTAGIRDVAMSSISVRKICEMGRKWTGTVTRLHCLGAESMGIIHVLSYHSSLSLPIVSHIILYLRHQ